jgi:hypothetical protein
MSKQLHIFTPVWGEHFTNLLLQALGRSLKWRQNAKSVENCIWTLFTSPSETESIRSLALSIIPTATVRVLTNDRLFEPRAPIGALKMQALLKSIRECLDENCTMLMSTPDFIWADGSIQHMWDQSYPEEGQGLCVSIAHMRVLPTILNRLPIGYSSEWGPGTLVNLGVKNAHASWIRSNGELNPNGIYHSGVAWRELEPCVLAVQHQMPSPFIANFKESDLEDFKTWKGVTPPAFGEWDHNWPSKLIEEGRLRYLGSSDLAFMVEVTEADKNVPPLEPAKTPHDLFFRTEPSVKMQKQFISTFRY